MERLRESFNSVQEIVDFLALSPSYINDLNEDEETPEERDEINRMTMEAERDFHYSRQRNEEFYRRMAGYGCTHLDSEVRIDWLKEGF